jgi:hypothetical protein
MSLQRTKAGRPAAPARAKTVGTPGTAGAKAKVVAGPTTGAAVFARMTAEDVVKELLRREDVALGNAYAMGLCLRELARPERYSGELGFKSFKALLAERDLPTRMTAHKLIAVVSTFSEAEVRRLGGVEKAYALIRWTKRKDPSGDPKRFLEAGARFGGKPVTDVSGRQIREALADLARSVTDTRESDEQTKRAARTLRTGFRKVKIAAAVRAHTRAESTAPYVGVQLRAAQAANLAALLKAVGKAGLT